MSPLRRPKNLSSRNESQSRKAPKSHAFEQGPARREQFARLALQLWSSDVQTRKDAVKSLRHFESNDAVKLLGSVLLDVSHDVRNVAARALATHANPKALPLLQKHFDRLDNRTREHVLDDVATVNTEAAGAFLCKSLKNKDFFIAQHALQHVLLRRKPAEYVAAAKTGTRPNDFQGVFSTNLRQSLLRAPADPAFIPALVEFVARNPSETSVAQNLAARLSNAGFTHPHAKPVWPWLHALFDKADNARGNTQGTARAIQHLQRHGSRAFKNTAQLRLFIKQAATNQTK